MESKFLSVGLARRLAPKGNESGRGDPNMHPGVRKLLKTKKRALDELYKESETGEIPVGRTQGWAVVFPGTFLAPIIAAFARCFFVAGQGL